MRRVLALLPIVALAGLGAGTSSAARKCGGQLQPNGKPLIFVDGVIAPAATELSKFSSGDIYSVDVVCMDPKDSTLNATRGIGVMSIWTRKGPAPRVAEPLEIIRQAQDRYFASHGYFFSTLDEIRFPENLKAIRVTMEAGPKGWVARTTIPRLLKTCVMFDGTVSTPLVGGLRRSECVRDF